MTYSNFGPTESSHSLHYGKIQVWLIGILPMSEVLVWTGAAGLDKSEDGLFLACPAAAWV